MMASRVFRVYDDEEVMLAVYDRRLRIADRKFEVRKPELEDFIARYANEVDEDQVTDEGHIVNVTTGIGIIDTLYSSLTAVDVEFIIRNLGRGTREQAIVATNALNQAWKDTRGQRRVKPSIKDALLVDIGWAKVYYDYVEDVETRDRPEEAIEAQITEVLGLDPELTEEEVRSLVPTTEEVTTVLRDRVCVDYVPWDMIRVDPTAKRIEDVRWVAQYSEHPVPEVRENPTYEEYVKGRYGERKGEKMLEDLEGNVSATSGLFKGDYADVEGLGEDEYGDDERICLVEFWDLETGLVTVFPKDHTDIILHQRVNPLMLNLDLEERNPFKPLILRDRPDTLEGLGDMRVIWPSLQELDEYRNNMATYIARSIPKLIGPERAMTPAGKKALGSQEWGAYVGLQEGFTHSDVDSIDPPALPQETFAVPDKIQYEMKEATGANEVLRGVFTSKRTTATEAQLVTSAGEARQAEKRSAVEEWYLDIARAMLQLMQLFYDQERISRYTDDLGREWVWSFTKEDIAIEADLDVSLTPRESPTRDERVQRALQVMNLSLPLPETDRVSLMQWVFEEYGLPEEVIRSIVKTPQEVQMEQQRDMLAQQIATKPQPFANSPVGLTVTPGGGA